MTGLSSTYTVLMGPAYVWSYNVMNGYFEALANLDSGNAQILRPVYDGLAHPSGDFVPVLFPETSGLRLESALNGRLLLKQPTTRFC